jgi:osmoprotectant transport system permease protein
MVNNSLIFAGALPAALLALFADLSLGWIEGRLRERV